MNTPQQAYMAFLLRLWLVKDEGQINWRISLEDTHTNERCSFTNLLDLVTYLENKVYQVVPEQSNTEEYEKGGDIHS